jgi:hypothetical protein
MATKVFNQGRGCFSEQTVMDMRVDMYRIYATLYAVDRYSGLPWPYGIQVTLERERVPFERIEEDGRFWESHAKVNWGCFGAASPQMAEEYAELLQSAIRVAESLTDVLEIERVPVVHRIVADALVEYVDRTDKRGEAAVEAAINDLNLTDWFPTLRCVFERKSMNGGTNGT